MQALANFLTFEVTMNQFEQENSLVQLSFPTHTFESPPLSSCGFGSGLQDTSRVMFCGNLPSTAPSVRWTESAARHCSDLDSIGGLLFSQPFFVAEIITDTPKFVKLATTIFDFNGELSGNCDDIFTSRHSRSLLLHD